VLAAPWPPVRTKTATRAADLPLGRSSEGWEEALAFEPLASMI
jgi:hypothetical protein